MNLKAVLFDLDGTLLPMDQDAFIERYLGLMAKKMAVYGYDPKRLVSGIWKGTGAMVKNDGTQTNEEVFWQTFSAAYGTDARKDEALFEAFYRNEFRNAKEVCGYAPAASQVVNMLKERGVRVVLATNPLFPPVATRSRAAWAGLDPEDFEFITTYDNSRFCKPNLDYYRDILDKIGLSADECLMVGNDVAEDMIAEKLGMKVFLLTDCLINKTGADISVFPNGSFPELMQYIYKLFAQ